MSTITTQIPTLSALELCFMGRGDESAIPNGSNRAHSNPSTQV